MGKKTDHKKYFSKLKWDSPVGGGVSLHQKYPESIPRALESGGGAAWPLGNALTTSMKIKISIEK